MLGIVIHDLPVQCAQDELAKFHAPPGQTCQSYAGPYTKEAGGYVTTLDSGLCGFCQYATGDQFGASFNVYYEVGHQSMASRLMLSNTNFPLASLATTTLWKDCANNAFSTYGETTASSGRSVSSTYASSLSARGCICKEARG